MQILGRARRLASEYMLAVEEFLSHMDTISLAEMESAALMNRCDTKYVVEIDELMDVLESVQDAYRVLSVDSVRLCPYRTLYFDTPAHRAYLEHHNGKRNRRKFRIRQYQSSGMTFLEVKTKNNKGRTDKQRIPIEDFELTLSPQSRTFIQKSAGEDEELKPQLWVQFSRMTLVNRGRPERVTVDLSLEFGFDRSEVELPKLVIIEVKQDADNRHSPIREHLRQMRIRPMRVSKYCLGVALLKSHLKTNRFKPKLRAIDKIADMRTRNGN